ncbi:uncharacterized protein LOC126370332 [Pectinophora gossypiella]|uniref:uncharacterized protein LOC126370332 n=1 Tax=Pectinophora gossypiella TaxID=13191 RepID=UPI00214E834F|nr:uncharacterized protein LOC126370332 [Pectinophora gossypiella]
MFRLLTILSLFALSFAAPAPKPVVVYPPVLPPVYHPPVLHSPYVHHAPVAVSHVSAVYGHPPVLPVRTVLPAAPIIPSSPFLY